MKLRNVKAVVVRLPFSIEMGVWIAGIATGILILVYGLAGVFFLNEIAVWMEGVGR